MAGVVAMASAIEDFDTQPCKKSRKDGGSPVVKTITNYFSPVAKPVEKPFSPPRSNNIMDYFSRKLPSSKEKTSPSQQSKENCQTPQSTEKCTSPEAAVRQPSQKRGRKATKTARKLVESEHSCFTATDSCLILNEPHQTKDMATEVISGCGVLGSDTAALLAELSAEASATAWTSEKTAAMAVVIDLTEKDEQHKQSCHKPKAELRCISSSSNVPLREKTKLLKTATWNSKNKLQENIKQPEPEEKEAETSFCDVSMEDNEDKASEANNSTVTISFEDFLRSQGQDEGEQDKEEGGKITTEAKEMDNDLLTNVSSGDPLLQLSPRIVTIQAEIHTVSPKQQTVKGVGKLASIFIKRKGAVSSVNVVPSPQTEVGHQSSSSLRSIKRKSNVVLQEEDLELAVLESETTPKCSETERKQFMAAFKQPNQDGSKTKPGKSQVKQKNLDPTENVAEEDSVIAPPVEQVPAASQESIVAKKKPTRKGKKKAQEENKTVATSFVAASPTAKEIGVTVIDVGDEQEEPTIPAVRRSRRVAVVRQAPDTTTATPVRETRKQKESMDDGDAAALPDCSENLSTPKTRRFKHGVFVAEMVGPPDVNESPIRIKFTRVHRNVSTSKAGSESGINTSKATKTSDNESKKRKQAKKLVEKAKVIQQSKKTSAEKRSPLRRSSRYEASIKKSYCENEDSVICLEDDQSVSSPLKVPENRKTRKPLRSLNDVLGKDTSAVKGTKAVPGSKAAMLGPEKSASKVSTVISIFDDSSREGSENSQDDEQFKARREFLKSGLPDSFRKQIAKNTATKEAYSLSCSSFQPVIHIKQSTNDCPLWTLSWPESSLMCPLKELWSPSSSFSFVSGSFDLKTEPAQRAFCERGSGWRPEISDSVRQLLIEEVSNSNPPFPAQMFITRFLKRRTDYQQHGCTASETTPLSGKRKRMDDGGENAVKVAKRQRGNHSDENVPKSEPRKRGGQAKRVRRFKTEKEAKDKVEPSDVSALIPCEEESVVVLDDLLPVKDTVEKDVMKEDVLWTEKYQPQHSSDIVGNSSSVRRLHSWLKEWKLRADQEERKKQKDKKQEEGNNDSDWDCGEDSQDTEDMVCNTMLITGPTGVGKTAAIYACAQELGFKVFEVNASSQRSGRLILSQLREATQSHQVDSQGVNAHKPTYFNSYSSSSSANTTRPAFSPRKVNSPRRVVSSPRKHPQSPRGAKKGALAPTSLVNFFKMSQPTMKDPHYTKKNEQAATSKKANNESANKQKDVTVKSASTASTPKEHSEEQSKKTATSLILFEEVDVIFDEDSGFLAAVKTFMTTTKRPVILTTSDPAFSTMFDGNFEEIHFKTPSVLNVGTYLQLLCLAEDMRTDPANISSLLRLNGCDIRQSLLQLQFWTRSAGGCYVTRPLKHPDTSELKPEPDREAGEMSLCQVTVPHALPPCDTGCTESMLGLLNLEPETDIWKLFRSQSLKEAVCWELLINSRRRGVDLLYTNMETLLPLPLTQLNSLTVKPVSESKDSLSDITKEQPLLDMLPSHTRLLHMAESGDCSDDSSPVKVSNRMRKNKRRHCLPVRDGQHSDSDSEEGFLSLCKPQGFAQDNERVSERVVPEKVKRKPLTAEERVKSLPVSQCLESIADFFDNMSYLDSSLFMYPEGGDVHRRTPAVSAVFKDGMTDELRVEADSGSWVSRERVLQIQAAVEALSFHKCRSSVTSAWDKSQQLEGELGKEAAEELTLPVASHRDGHTLSQDGPCQLQLVQRRREVVESLILKGVVGLGNRPAAALDYLPILRTICRSERLKEKGKIKRRFLHYLDAIHLGLEKSIIEHLTKDFP